MIFLSSNDQTHACKNGGLELKRRQVDGTIKGYEFIGRSFSYSSQTFGPVLVHNLAILRWDE